MVDLVTRQRKDHQVTFEDLVFAKVSFFFSFKIMKKKEQKTKFGSVDPWIILQALEQALFGLHHNPKNLLFMLPFSCLQGTYEKGTNDEIEKFIYQLLDVSGDGILGRYKYPV